MEPKSERGPEERPALLCSQQPVPTMDETIKHAPSTQAETAAAVPSLTRV